MGPFLSYSRGSSRRGGCNDRGGKTFLASNTCTGTITSKHKWIRPKQGRNISSSTGTGTTTCTSKLNTVVTGTSTNNVVTDDEPKSTRIDDENDSVKLTDELIPQNKKPKYLTASSKYVIMKKNGHNQLIFSGIGTTSASKPPDESESERFTQRRTLTRDGNHKLISTSKGNKSKKNHPKKNHDKKFQSYRTNNCSVNDAKRKYFPSTLPAAKRVKLPPKDTNINTKCDTSVDKHRTAALTGNDQHFNVVTAEDESENKLCDDNNKDSSSDQSSGKLTDFAYRQTSRVRHKNQSSTTRSRNLRWFKKEQTSNNPIASSIDLNNKTSNNHKNMGLVRVQPNNNGTTGICRTFLRGIQCQNQYCRKRHDIPKELAVPICSFFQRHGQCLRGESCVFRHIRYPLCPYCQKRHDPSKEFCSYFNKT